MSSLSKCSTHLPRNLLWQRSYIRQPLRVLPRQFLITLKQRALAVPSQKPGPIPPLAGKGRAHPVVDWRGHDPDGLSGVRFFSKHQQSLGVLALARCIEQLDLLQCYWIEGQVVHQWSNV